MGLSVNQFTYAGVDEFDLNFAMGFSSRSDIDCYIEGEFPIDVEFDWLTNSRVRIVPTDVQIGDTITFTRTVSKDSIPVDLTQPNNLTRESIDTAIRHTVYMMHEVLDGRVNDSIDINDLIFNSVNNAVVLALANYVSRSYLKRDVVIQSQFSSENVVESYTSGGVFCEAEDVLIFVVNPPNVQTEYLISNGGQVQFSVTIGTDGSEIQRSASRVLLSSGPITSNVTGGNYTSGVDLVFVLPMVSQSTIDFNAEVDDYVELLTEARNT